MDNRQIGSFIAACRKEKNLTQRELGEKLHVTDRAVSKWENGRFFQVWRRMVFRSIESRKDTVWHYHSVRYVLPGRICGNYVKNTAGRMGKRKISLEKDENNIEEKAVAI